MTLSEATALARYWYLEEPEVWHKLRPVPRGDLWALECWITPVFGWMAHSPDQISDGLRRVFAGTDQQGRSHGANS